MNNQPFKRLLAMLGIAKTLTGLKRSAFLSTYKSRGHSKAGAIHSPSHKHMSIKRATAAKHNVKVRSKK